MRSRTLFSFTLALLAASAVAQPIIQTVAGGGPDNLPAIEANVATPTGVAADGFGNLFIVSQSLHRVFKVDAGGTLTVAAGTGLQGFSGDGGPATSASLSLPFGVAVDGTGNLFIADTSNRRIRKVDPSGTITTVAGNSLCCFSGDGGPATSALLRFPGGVAVDGIGNLFIADSGNARVLKVDSSGIITTVAGNGSFGFSGDGGPATNALLFNPLGVAVDGAGNLFIADTSNRRIRKVDSSGTITTVAGNGSDGFSGDGGPATSASLADPWGVALGGAGNLFIADRDNRRIRRVDSSGIITTVAGNGLSGFSGDGGLATSASLNFPVDVAVDGAGNLFIADTNNSRIRKVDSNGIITTVAGNGSFGFSGDGGLATNASLATPLGVAVDAAGALFIAEVNNNRIRRVIFDPITLLERLVFMVMSLNLQHGIENSLDAKLEAARQALVDLNENNDVAAVNALEAFINSVEAQRGDAISEADADRLIAAAQIILNLLVE
jgi:sugar lactone lactonase YvrE